MKLSIEIKNHPNMLNFSTFPGGEESVQIQYVKMLRESAEHGRTITVIARLRSSQDVMRFFLTLDALHQLDIYNIEAVIPYIPYARQDRVCRDGEANSLKMFAQMLNSFNLKRVTYWDEHSPLTSAYINNGINETTHNLINLSSIIHLSDMGSLIPPVLKDYVLIIPDAGAQKRVMKVANFYKLPCIQVMKTRDYVTGKVDIVEIFFPRGLKMENKQLLIVDDICDGGRTFTAIAEELRKGWPQIKSLSLYVTHGIFSKGLEVFDNLIDHIYTTDSICTLEEKDHSQLTIVKGLI